MLAFTLYVLMFLPGGGFDKEVHPIEVPACVNGIEDSTCGIRACLLAGKKRAAELAGYRPGVGFGVMCNKKDGTERAAIGAEPAGGHASMNWQPQPNG